MSSKSIAITRPRPRHLNLNEQMATFVSTSPASSVMSSSTLSSGLYVPVHRRRASMSHRTDDSISMSSSSRPSSRAESHADSSESLVYSRERLMGLSKSPLAVMPKEIKEILRETVPEIVMSRKHRKALEYRARAQQSANGATNGANGVNPKADEPQHATHVEHEQKRQERRKQVQHMQEPLPTSAPVSSTPEAAHQRQVLHHSHSPHHPHEHHAQPRANHSNQQKRWSTRAAAADMDWRRTAAPPSITVA